VGHDFWYAARMLGKNGGFTLVAVLTLAIGIGGNTTIFSVMDAFVLAGLRLQRPDELVVISEAMTKGSGRHRQNPTMAMYLDWKKNSRSFQDIARTDFDGFEQTVTGLGRAERASVAVCTTSLFPMLGIHASRGRTFLPEDALKGIGTTALISDSFWRRAYGADPDILGKTIVEDDVKFTIVGILPPGFSLLPWDTKVDVWEGYNPAWTPHSRWLTTIGRLKPGTTMEQAAAELNAIAHRPEQPDAAANREWKIRLETLHETIVGETRGYFSVLLGAVGFILLIACANVANLVLARGAVRRKEMAIRASLGAGRFRLIRQLLAESLLIALAGGAFGGLLAFWGVRIFQALAPFDAFRLLPIKVDWRILGFTLGISVFTAILFGLVPALRASKPDLQGPLQEGGRQSAGALRLRSQSVLLISEISLAIVLLTGAGLLFNSFLRAQNVKLGFDPRNILRAEVFLAGPKYRSNLPGDIKRVTPQGAIYFERVLERVRALPGVVSAGLSGQGRRGFRILGRPSPAAEQVPSATYNEVSGGLFDALKIPLLKGRYVNDRDTETSQWVVDINETMARRFFPNEDPIGKFIQLTILGGAAGFNVEEKQTREIVGVVGDVRYGFGRELHPIMYGSYRQFVTDYPGGEYMVHDWKTITARTQGDPLRLSTALKRAGEEVDKDQPVFNINSMEHELVESLGFERFQMRLFSAFAGIGLFLAAVGIYGVMSYLVAQRRHEIGIRVALGARHGNIVRLVMGRGLRSTLIGVAVGIAASLALTRLIADQLFGVKTTDVLTYSIVVIVLITAATTACYLPAHRAANIQPMEALRHE
jgi:putative ABC transport system permease protein